MKFKTDRIHAEWLSPHLDGRLKQIVSEAANRADQRWDWEFTLTCIYRTPEENDALYGHDGKHRMGVHVMWRGADVRIYGVDADAVLDIATFVNDRWNYDPDREGMRCALIEGNGVGSSARHVHFQSSPNTVERETL